MRLACHHSEQWLRQTIHAWLAPSARHVSTSSAINRGLRRGKFMYAAAARAKREGKSGTAHIRFGPRRERKLNERSALEDLHRKREWEAGKGQHLHLSQLNENSAQEDAERKWQWEAGEGRYLHLSEFNEKSAQEDADRKRQEEAGKGRRHKRLNLGYGTAPSTKSLDRRARKQHTQPEYHSQLRRHRQETAVHERENASTRNRLEQEEQTATKEDDASPGLGAAKLIEALGDQMASIRQYETIMFETPNAELRKAQRLVDWVNEDLQRQGLRTPQLRNLLRSTMGATTGGQELWSNASTGDRSNYTQLRIKIQARQTASLRLYVPSSDALSAQRPASKPAQGGTRQLQELESHQNQSKNGKSLHKSIDADNDDDDDVPVFIPYTTAASVFLYGSNTVLAALRAQRRKLYNLYLHPRLSSREDNAEAIKKLAKQLKITTVHHPSLAFLDKASEHRPHNGVVLEASRLPTPPVLALSKPNRRTSIVPLVLDRQSAEDVHVNGAPEAMSTLTQTWRHPFVLMLDGILDPGNVGNILRTAHFYGVDAVAVATNTCASLALATLAKASSGACEALRIFALPRPADFVRDSVQAGWHAYAAVAAPSHRPKELWTRKELDLNTTTTEVARSSPLAEHPAILILGAEGEGLRENLKNKATRFVTIDHGPRASDDDQVGEREDVGVDSLNVSVAAGVLVEAFMRRPEGAEDIDTFGELGF